MWRLNSGTESWVQAGMSVITPWGTMVQVLRSGEVISWMPWPVLIM